MKILSFIFLIILLLSSCIPATPLPTSTATPTEAPTITPTITFTPTPTSTPIPTVTSTPSLPNTIEFSFEKPISEKTQNEIKAIVNQAYWFYVGVGCSPDGFRANFYVGKEGGEGGYADTDNKGVWMETGVASIDTDPNKVTNGISHELAHVMCQLAFTKPKTGQFGAMDMRWLTEALANYFSAWERITNTGSDFGAKTISEWEIGGAQGVTRKYCGFSLALLEASNADQIYRDEYYTAGHTAIVLLGKIAPDGITALLNYYKLLNKNSASKSFQEAFGKTKEEFYKQFQEECNNGFPAITGTITPIDGVISIQGNVVFTDKSLKFTDYMITFCNIKKNECGPSTDFRKDGTFLIDLELGAYYKASINPSNGGEPVGWYNSKGLVKNNTCAGLIKITQNMKITITIDPKNILPCT